MFEISGDIAIKACVQGKRKGGGFDWLTSGDV